MTGSAKQSIKLLHKSGLLRRCAPCNDDLHPLEPLSISSSYSQEPRPEERRLRRVSTDEATAGASWFETTQGRLLTMRGKTYSLGRLSMTPLPLPTHPSRASPPTALMRPPL